MNWRTKKSRLAFATVLSSISMLALLGFTNPDQAHITLSDLDNYLSPQVKQWVQRHRDRTRAYLDANPLKDQISKRYQELKDNSPPLTVQFQSTFNGVPVENRVYIAGGSLVISRNGSEHIKLVDVKTLPENNFVSLFKVSPDFRNIGYGTVEGGTDWQIWKVVSIPQSSSESPVISTSFFETNTIAEVHWSNDSSSLYYGYFGNREGFESALPDRTVQVRRHGFQMPQNSINIQRSIIPMDQIVYEDHEQPPYVAFAGQETTDGRVIVYRYQGIAEIPLATYLLEQKDIIEGRFDRKKAVLPPYKFFGTFLGTRGKKAYYRTSACESNGSFYCIMAVDLHTLKRETVIPAVNGEMLLHAMLGESNVFLQYFHSSPVGQYDINQEGLFEGRVEVYNFATKNKTVFDLKDQNIYPTGRFSAFSMSKWSDTVDFSLSNFVDGVIAMRIDPRLETLTNLNPRKSAFAKDQIKIELRDYVSDGVRIPMHVFTRKDMSEINPAKFVYLYYYGAIGIANFLNWTVKMQMALELGGMVAVPYVRGGGEFGLDWQLLGSRNKDLTFLDIANSSRFIRENYPVELDPWGKKRVVGSGRSFGGWHTFAQMVRYNDDFSAFIPGVPVFDVGYSLRHGTGWWMVDDFEFERNPETGNVVDFEREVSRVSQWDSLHDFDNIKVAKPTIIFSGDHDTRVKPTQPYRGALSLFQKFPDSPDIYLMDYPNTGHGSRPEGLDEVLWLSQIYSIDKLQPLQ